MQPFDKHLADPDELARYSSRLIGWGADALQNGLGTKRPYAPAIADWDGMCPPEIKTAYDSTEHDVALDGALVWAAVCMAIWAQRVAWYNRCVDEIQAGGQAGAEQAWWQVYDEQINKGTAEVAALLQQGPTLANMTRAKDFGVLPDQSRNPLPYIKDGLDGLRQLTSIPNAIGRTRNCADAAQKLRYGNQDFTKSRFAPELKPKPDHEIGFKRCGDASKWLGHIGTAYCFGASYADQRSRDTGRPDVGDAEGFIRGIYRGGVVTVGVKVGGGAGAALGQAAGSLVAGPPGAVVGKVVGGAGGGIVGAGVANKIADHTVDAVGSLGRPVDQAVDMVFTTATAAGFSVTKAFVGGDLLIHDQHAGIGAGDLFPVVAEREDFRASGNRDGVRGN